MVWSKIKLKILIIQHSNTVKGSYKINVLPARFFSPFWNKNNDFFVSALHKPIDTNFYSSAGKYFLISMTKINRCTLTSRTMKR